MRLWSDIAVPALAGGGRRPPRKRRRRGAAACWLGLVMALATMSTMSAAGQRPERPQEANVPDIGVTLPAGWQLLIHDGCQFAAPASWRVEGDGALALAPDGAISVSLGSVAITNWFLHKERLRSDVPPSAVHQDSDSRFWCEFRDAVGVTEYVEVPNGRAACTAQIAVRASATPQAEGIIGRIVASVAPAAAIKK